MHAALSASQLRNGEQFNENFVKSTFWSTARGKKKNVYYFFCVLCIDIAEPGIPVPSYCSYPAGTCDYIIVRVLIIMYLSTPSTVL